MIWKIACALIAVILLSALGVLAFHRLGGGAPARPIAVAFPHPALGPDQACDPAPAFADAAARNAASLTSAPWSVFGRLEAGWETYAPLTTREIASACPPSAEGFAAALAAWQASQHLPAAGVMDEPTLQALRQVWLRRRPFVAATAHGVCPPPPPPDQLAVLRPEEAYGPQPIQLGVNVLVAYRALVAAARADSSAIRADRRLLTIFSGYRDPTVDAIRCAAAGDCGTITRANCSAHRTGTAIDIYLGEAPGLRPDSSADPNRLFQSRSPAYRWMVANADRFGFVNYPFEPWHWEWVGARP